MTNLQQRQNDIKSRIAEAAFKQPILNSGLLFHHDIRDNFYFASYLFAASQEEAVPFEGDREQAKIKAEGILLHILELQDQNEESVNYGHWPLHLRPTPQEAPKNTLPVELMGSLMVYFYQRYSDSLSESLRNLFAVALLHVYRSDFYRRPSEHYNHHEAKYTAAKLIFGQFYEDTALLEDGCLSLRSTLNRVISRGMSEYGGLPWFWHWMQAFTCAWELMMDVEIKSELARLLDYLWEVRSTYYLGGAWVGPHSRIWPHDMPRDTNVLHDYVQFGDFILPDQMPRTEYAGFIAYEASSEVKRSALQRTAPVEVIRRVPKQAVLAVSDNDVLHSYVYITENFALGGMWERVLEFDNEQHRWDIALPLDAVQGINHLYFFHPGQGYAQEDLRHQSEFSEVLFHQNALIASYQIPDGQPEFILGCLPVGDWVEEPNGLFGLCGHVYMAVYVQQSFQREVREDRSVVTSQGRMNSVVVECIDQRTAETLQIRDVQQFVNRMKQKQPVYTLSSEDELLITYTTLKDETMVLSSGLHRDRKIIRLVNGEAVDFSSYTVS